ncbi:MAG: alpha/beta hydrolase-fold protein [Rhizomicrobium sp.]
MLWRLAAAGALLLALGSASHAGGTKANGIPFDDDAPPCAAHPNAEVCSYPAPSEREAASELKQRVFVMVQNGKFLDVVLKHGNDFTYGRVPEVAGDVETPLDRIGDGLWGKRLFLPDLDHAVIEIGLANAVGVEPASFSGPHADHLLVKEGTFPSIEKTTIHSKALNADRDIYVYRGEKCRTTVEGCRIIYFADGAEFGLFLLNQPKEEKEVALKNLVIVGLADPSNDGKAGDPNFSRKRAGELLSVLHQPDYARFQNFLTDEVIPAIEKGGKPSARYAAGYSNGGAWAMSTMLEHPELFQGALAFSPGWFEAPQNADGSGHIVWIGSGKLEGAMYRDAQSYAKILAEMHADVRSRYLVGGHNEATWNALFWWAVGSWN